MPEEVEEAGEVLADLVEREGGPGVLPHGLLHLQQAGALAPVEEEVYGREAGGDQLAGRARARGRSWILALGLGGEGLGPQLALVQCGAWTGRASYPRAQTHSARTFLANEVSCCVCRLPGQPAGVVGAGHQASVLVSECLPQPAVL